MFWTRLLWMLPCQAFRRHTTSCTSCRDRLILSNKIGKRPRTLRMRPSDLACSGSSTLADLAMMPIPNFLPTFEAGMRWARFLRESGIETIEFRAGMVIGAGSLSFQLMKSLTDRLPIMICPRWLITPTQPIAVDDVLAYLTAAKDLPKGKSRIFEIGSPDVVTYGNLIREYARQQGLRRWLIFVPILTPYLSGLWLALVTPATYEVGRHLIEGLKNPTVVRDSTALDVFSIRPMRVKEAIQRAIAGAT